MHRISTICAGRCSSLARLCLGLLLCAGSAGLPPRLPGLAPQPALPSVSGPTSAPRSAPPNPQAILPQGLLDHDDYIASPDALRDTDAAALTEAQRNYFLGMLGFHPGKLDDGAQYLLKAANASVSRSLTANQVEATLEALGQINLKLGFFGGSAQMYDDIEKAFGAKLGDGEKTIREERHLAALLMHVPRRTAEIAGNFTLERSTSQYGDEYPVSVEGKPFGAQFDTGAEITVLSASTAKAWGVTMLDGTATLHGYDGGAFSAQPGFLASLTIGKAELHNVAAYVTSDENLYVPQIKHQAHALLGYPVVAALGRLTFAKDSSLTVSTQFVPRDLNKSAALWMAGHSLLVALGTQVVASGNKGDWSYGNAAVRLRQWVSQHLSDRPPSRRAHQRLSWNST